MAEVPTVTGMVEADELGTTLIHEHLRNRDEAVDSQWPTVALSVKEEKPYEVPPDQIFEIARITSDAVEIRREQPVGLAGLQQLQSSAKPGRDHALCLATSRQRHSAPLKCAGVNHCSNGQVVHVSGTHQPLPPGGS